jgi:hypothetical protein
MEYVQQGVYDLVSQSMTPIFTRVTTFWRIINCDQVRFDKKGGNNYEP